ncbi:MAG: cupin domain-containing protein [Magnetospirillum sp.]|nr:cupin domain-containing protein [Magnetospirillum sp.]
MPRITRPDGTVLERHDALSLVRTLGLSLSSGTPPGSAALAEVLADHHLDDARTNAILDEVAATLDGGFAGRDVVALFPDTPNLAGILDLFRRPHRHADAGSRLILAGAGVFGFVLPDGGQAEMTVAAGDFVHIPAGTEHWFRLTEHRTLVAVRLFQENPDWRAEYTGTPVQFPH